MLDVWVVPLGHASSSTSHGCGSGSTAGWGSTVSGTVVCGRLGTRERLVGDGGEVDRAAVFGGEPEAGTR